MTKIKLVAFDWNGTILSDTVACLVGDDAALISLGYKPISMRKFRETFEIPLVKFYSKIGVDMNIPKERFIASEEEFLRTYEARAAKSRTRAGARDLFKWLKKNNIPAIIFSNHVADRINDHLKRLKIEDHFETVIGNKYTTKDLIVNRSKGEKLKAYLDSKKVNHKEILIVGDTTEEIEIAHEIGAISVALTHGYNSTSRLKSAGPDYLLGDLRQIKGIIRKLQNKTA